MTMDIRPEDDFGRIPDLVQAHARQRPDAIAVADDGGGLSWRELDGMMDRVACALQREGMGPGDSVAICAAPSAHYAAVFLGAVRAGVAVAPLPPTAMPATLERMLSDTGTQLVFVDAAGDALLRTGQAAPRRVALEALDGWLAPAGCLPVRPAIGPDTAFNIIYSSGTTGEPKGIVQSHGMRWTHVVRAARHGYGVDTVALLSTPLYSNTTLVAFLPAIAYGGCTVLMPKFDAGRFLQLSAAWRATHAMLVPVQYQRLLAHADFGRTDLGSYRYKFCTSAPFSMGLKAEVLQRWPGGLVELYGMTEGGATCMLEAHLHPGKLHTVGRPAAGCDVRLVDEQGRDAAPGQPGEVVGHSAAMMLGYLHQPGKTREVEWWSPEGRRFIRTGDIGRFDADGFLILVDRKKDMIISGGYNIFPSDLEAVLREHPAVAEAAVVGLPSETWGETPAALLVCRPGESVEAEALRAWANTRLGKTQRIATLACVDALPRSEIGKVLKRELRERLLRAAVPPLHPA